MTVEVGRVYRFRARHSLPDAGEPWCHQHEHDYRIEVVARSGGDGAHGMVVDTDQLDAVWVALCPQLNGRDLNQSLRTLAEPTTVEVFASWLLGVFKATVAEVAAVTVWEDDQRWGRCCC